MSIIPNKRHINYIIIHLLTNNNNKVNKSKQTNKQTTNKQINTNTNKSWRTTIDLLFSAFNRTLPLLRLCSIMPSGLSNKQTNKQTNKTFQRSTKMCVQTLTLFSCYDSRQKYLPLYVTFYGKFVKVLLKHRFLLIPEGIIAQ